MVAESGARGTIGIGDVLALLKAEFPDASISKIRFLESKGLISPDRTSSGYRKYAPADVERLRVAMSLQRDQFLPLRVIRERLAEWDRTGVLHSGSAAAPASSEPDGAVGSSPVDGPGAESLQLQIPGAFSEAATLLGQGGSGVHLSREEICRAAGIEAAVLDQIESFGLVRPRPGGEAPTYDEEALLIARLSRDLFAYGLEPRHLRMYRNSADREAGILQQVVAPYLRQRNPDSRAKAIKALADLANLGRRMEAALLRSILREALNG